MLRGGPRDSPALSRAAAVVGHRRDVLDAEDLEARSLQRADGGFASRSRALHHHVDAPDAVLLGASRGGLGRLLRGIGRGLARALEANVARRRPRQHVSVRIGDRDDGVRESRLDVSDAVDDVLLLSPPRLLALLWVSQLLLLLLSL